MSIPTPRDLQRLQGVHPRLAKALLQIINELQMFIVQGVRTAQEQAALYAKGRTAPGPIVSETSLSPRTFPLYVLLTLSIRNSTETIPLSR